MSTNINKKKLTTPTPGPSPLRAMTLPRGEEADVFVSVGGVAYQIPRGKTVQVPQAVQEVLMRSFAQQKIRDEYIDRHAQ